MTKDERFMQGVQKCFGDVKHWRQSADDLMKELAAHGLGVVELDPVSQETNSVEIGCSNEAAGDIGADGTGCATGANLVAAMQAIPYRDAEIGERSELSASPTCRPAEGVGDVPIGNEGRQTAHPSPSDREMAIARVLCEVSGQYPRCLHGVALQRGESAPISMKPKMPWGGRARQQGFGELPPFLHFSHAGDEAPNVPASEERELSASPGAEGDESCG